MVPSIDDKKYASDPRLFKDAVIQDGIFKNFEPSPLIDQVGVKDVCIYGAGTPKPGVTNPDPYNPADWVVLPDYNKLGKVSERTSWDSFSYAIQMGHNVWAHVNAVQEANRQYDSGTYPYMMSVADANRKVHRQYDQMFFKDIVNEIFATSDKGKAEALVKEYHKYWMDIPGTRGYKGLKTVSARPQFDKLFEVIEPEPLSEGEFAEDVESKLDLLESEVKHDAT